jgi:DNA-binding NarL/FixJ family response regulator
MRVHNGSTRSVAMRRISVVLVDDHAAIRRGLGSLLQSQPLFALVEEADYGWRAVRLISRTRPDVVVMDVPRVVMDGSQMARRILGIVPGTRIVALTSYGDDENVVQLLQAGVAGVLIKQTAVNDLVRAIHKVQTGAFFSPLIPARLRSCGQNPQTSTPPATIPEWGSAGPHYDPIGTNTGASRRGLAAA